MVSVASGCWVPGAGWGRRWRALSALSLVIGAPVTVIAQAAVPSQGDAVAQASPYLPLDDIAYQYIDALMARGELRALSALERPYTVGAVRAALAPGPPSPRGRVLESWVMALGESLGKHDPSGGSRRPDPRRGLEVRASLVPFATAQTSARRELMRGDGEAGVYPGLAMELGIRGRAVVAVTRVLSDLRYKDDPEYSGKQDRIVAGRVEDAYLAGQWRYGTLALGRLSRNWGPYRLDGLQLGHYAYTYDHLYGRLGTDRLNLAALFATLDDMTLGSDSIAQRYVAMHRLAGRWRSLELAVSETFLYGGVGRGLDLSFLNPFNVHQLTWYNERKEGNVSYALDVAWRGSPAGRVLSAQLFLDDYQVDRCDPLCHEPPSYGITLAAEGLPLPAGAAHRWFASYTRLTYLAYRAPRAIERYAILGLALGRGFTDYDELRAGLDLAALPRTTLRVYAAYRRQGEGDYRAPFPDPEEYAATPEFLGGVVTRVARLGVSGAAMARRGVEITWDAGYNREVDAGHVAGATRSGVEGRLRVAFAPPPRPVGWP